MHTYEVTATLGKTSDLADQKIRVQAVGPAQAMKLVEGMFPSAWVKRAELIG